MSQTRSSHFKAIAGLVALGVLVAGLLLFVPGKVIRAQDGYPPPPADTSEPPGYPPPPADTSEPPGYPPPPADTPEPPSYPPPPADTPTAPPPAETPLPPDATQPPAYPGPVDTPTAAATTVPGYQGNSDHPRSSVPSHMRTRETDPINSSSYEVQAGDTLFRIALRAGTTVQALMAANGLRSAHIYPGQTLVMPAGPRPSPAAPGQGGGASTPGGYGVKAGDTLYQIARQQGVTVQALMAANGLRSVVIRPGQTLIIPGATPRATSTAMASPESNAYTVQQGDTLFRIALNHGVSLQALMAANHLTGTQIRPGQNLVIP